MLTRNQQAMKIAIIVLCWMLTGTYATCVIPSGLGTGPGQINYDSFSFPPEGYWQSTFNAIFANQLSYALSFETTIQIRNGDVPNSMVYTAAAAYDPIALEAFGRINVSDSYRRCQPSPTNGISTVLFEQHRNTTLAYIFLLAVSNSYPDAKTFVTSTAASWKLDYNICQTKNCSDLSSPWGLAFTIYNDISLIASKDGWNSDGSLSSIYNRVPYKDWREKPYVPNFSKPNSWRPLQETNQKGFLYNQIHVTSHIGFTAKSFYVGDQKICKRQSPSPNYDYNLEAKLTLDRMKNLDDTKKMVAEFFDSKLTSLVLLAFQHFFRRAALLGKSWTFDSFEFLKFDRGANMVLMEAVIQVWRDKIKFDAVRPTTVIRNRFKGKLVNTWLGPSNGTSGLLQGKDFAAYLRVMPHAEYPSGSSCMCTAFARFMALYFGSDNVTDTIGGPLVQIIPAGSSKVEPGRTPTQNLTLSFETWSEIGDSCSYSRLDAGLHFTKSIPAGKNLCGVIGDDVYSYLTNLGNGVARSFSVDLYGNPKQKRYCD